MAKHFPPPTPGPAVLGSPPRWSGLTDPGSACPGTLWRVRAWLCWFVRSPGRAAVAVVRRVTAHLRWWLVVGAASCSTRWLCCCAAGLDQGCGVPGCLWVWGDP